MSRPDTRRHANRNTAATGPILHVDMDAFFASVEQLDHPAWRGKPVVVGSPPDRRGVVAAASYEARRFGVHSAMPSRTAYKHCPHAIFVRPRFDRYKEVSGRIMEIFGRLTPLVEPISIDEAFLDVRGAGRRQLSGLEAARWVRHCIHEEIGLTASVGVAPNKFLAKLASDMDKPDGLTLVPTDPDGIRAFLRPLPVRRIWGVGPSTESRLHAAGLRTVGDIQDLSLEAAVRLLGTTQGAAIHRLAFGRDDRNVHPGPRPEKSISHEETFGEDCSDTAVVRRTLLHLTEKVGRRLRRSGKDAATVFIKLRFADFQTLTRQTPLRPPGHSDRRLLQAALQLFDNEPQPQPVRLVGVGVANLQDPEQGPRQPTLFDPPTDPEQERNDALDRTVDLLRETYGDTILRRGL